MFFCIPIYRYTYRTSISYISLFAKKNSNTCSIGWYGAKKTWTKKKIRATCLFFDAIFLCYLLLRLVRHLTTRKQVLEAIALDVFFFLKDDGPNIESTFTSILLFAKTIMLLHFVITGAKKYPETFRDSYYVKKASLPCFTKNKIKTK